MFHIWCIPCMAFSDSIVQDAIFVDILDVGVVGWITTCVLHVWSVADLV